MRKDWLKPYLEKMQYIDVKDFIKISAATWEHGECDFGFGR